MSVVPLSECRFYIMISRSRHVGVTERGETKPVELMRENLPVGSVTERWCLRTHKHRRTDDCSEVTVSSALSSHHVQKPLSPILGRYTVCPTRYRTRHFFNNSNTNEDIATKFEQEYVRCVGNEKECVPKRYMKNPFIQRRLVFGVGCPGGA